MSVLLKHHPLGGHTAAVRASGCWLLRSLVFHLCLSLLNCSLRVPSTTFCELALLLPVDAITSQRLHWCTLLSRIRQERDVKKACDLGFHWED